MKINNKKIKQIVAAGCSLTYGAGLDDPKTQAWPVLLANKFDIECVNLGRSGMGNEYIQSTLLDYFITNPEMKHNSMVIPAYSYFGRIEFRGRNHKSIWTTLSKNNDNTLPDIKEFKQMFFEELFNENYYYDRYLRIIITLQSLLQYWDIPYLMFEGHGANPHKQMVTYHHTRKLLKEIDHTNWMRFGFDNIHTLTHGYEKTSCEHPGRLAQVKIAETLYNHIINNYNVEK
jgi:hypothetical protein